MKWRYDPSRARLNAWNPDLDLVALRSVLRQHLTSRSINEIIYATPGVTLVLRGDHLRRWIVGETLMLACRPRDGVLCGFAEISND